MRYIAISIVFSFVFSGWLVAQEHLNMLQAPTSPAAGILDLQPRAVLSPKSYEALETALYSNFVGNNNGTVIPSDFALEFTPYWVFDHGLSLSEYLYPDDLLEQWVRNSSFSLASTQNFVLGDSTSTNGLAFGYRTTFYIPNGEDKKRIESYTETLSINQKVITKLVLVSERTIITESVSGKSDFLLKIKNQLAVIMADSGLFKSNAETDAVIDEIYSEATNLPPLDPLNPDEFLNSFYSLVDSSIEADRLFYEFKDYIRNRQGFSIDVAVASLVNFPTNAFQFTYIPKSSVWITPTYRFDNQFNFLKISGVFRYEWYNDDYYDRYFPGKIVYMNNLDFGLAAVSEFNRFSLQFEVVGRTSSSNFKAGTDIAGNDLFRKENNSDLQYIGTFSYNLTDQINITYTLGNRFEPIADPLDTLVSLLALNFGFGAPTKDDLDLKK